METLLQDLRYGIRMLFRYRMVTLIAIGALALGIGANTAIFSLVNAVLLRPLPYPNADRLVLLWDKFRDQGLDQITVSPLEFNDYRDQNRSFEQIALFDTSDINLTAGDAPERVSGAVVSASLFQVLGVNPIAGRYLLPEENQAGHDDVAVIGAGLWQRDFASDPNLVGKSVELNSRKVTIVGIMPGDFHFPISLYGVKGEYFTQPPEIWTPAVYTAEQMQNRGARQYGVIGRLKPGVSVAMANSDIKAIAAGMLKRFPNDYPRNGWDANVVSLHEQVVGVMRPMLLLLFGAVGFVLLIACANVANLLLARAASREKEVAIRAALGAGRTRLIRQLLTESILLALIGGGLGILLAKWGVDLLRLYGAQTLPRIKEIGLDGRVLLFTLAVSLLTGALFGLAPALNVTKPDLNESLKAGGRSASGGSGHQALRKVTVVAEVAISLLLLVGAGLMLKSFWRLQQVDPGFKAQNLLTLQVSLPEAKYQRKDQVVSFYDSALSKIQALPGVQSAGGSDIIPLSGSNVDDGFVIEGEMPASMDQLPDEETRRVSVDYFRTMGIPLIKGRNFTIADTGQPPVTIINRALERKFFRNSEAIGRRITFEDPRLGAVHWLTIVGVVGDIHHEGLNIEVKPELYLPIRQRFERGMVLVVRTSNDPLSATAAVRGAIASIDPNLPIYNIRTMEQVVGESTAQKRLLTILLGGFAALALILASVGIYGVISYSVTQRTHEIGIRMALGAQVYDVLKMVLRDGMTMILIGVGIGSGAALGLTRFMVSQLYGVSATDPLVLTGVAVLLTLVALLACYIPARRATNVDPLSALRYE